VSDFHSQLLTSAMLQLTKTVSDSSARMAVAGTGNLSDPSRAVVDELKATLQDVLNTAAHGGTMGDTRVTAGARGGSIRTGASGNADLGQRDATAGEKLAMRIGSSVGSAFMSIGQLLTSRFVTVLGPLVALGSIISSATSGFGVLFSAMKVLAATLAPLILPVVVAVATALNALGDVLWAKIQPALGEFYNAIFEVLIPAFQGLVEVVEMLADAMGDFAKSLPRFKGTAQEKADRDFILKQAVERGYISQKDADLTRNLKSSREIIDAAGGDSAVDAARMGVGEKVPDRTRPARATGGAGTTSGLTGVSAGMASSFSEIVRELRISSGPSASFSDITGVSRNAQLAASNASPLEAKVLERMDKVLTALESIDAKTKPAGLSY
jgi:hypothetical protein